MAGAIFSHNHTAGATRDGRIKWDISWRTQRALRELPLDIMYSKFWPTSKLASPNWSATAAGWVEVDGIRYAFDSAPLHQGHHWGRRMARSWVWAYSNRFEESDFTVFEALATKAFGIPVAIFIFQLGWKVYHAFTICPSPPSLSKRGRRVGEGWSFDVKKDGMRFKGEITAPPTNPIELTYDAPDGSTRHCRHWPFAETRIEVFERGLQKPRIVLNSKWTSLEMVHTL